MGIAMNPFLLSDKERLLSWKSLRNEITPKSDDEKFEAVLRWWSKAPICAYSIDGSNCTEWPTAWELLNENMFCTSSIAFMMAHTLALSGFDRDRMRLVFVRGNDDERLVLVIDENIVLNYSYGELYGWPEILDEVEARQSFKFVGDKFVEV